MRNENKVVFREYLKKIGNVVAQFAYEIEKLKYASADTMSMTCLSMGCQIAAIACRDIQKLTQKSVKFVLGKHK